MLGKIVHKVGFSWMPIYSKLSLCFAIAEPMDPHINCLCLLWLDLIIYYYLRRCIVHLGWGSWLQMTHLGEYLA
jgi:hypothetical protein